MPPPLRRHTSAAARIFSSGVNRGCLSASCSLAPPPRGVAQSSPVHPSKHAQTDDGRHAPRAEHLLGHALVAHASPSHPLLAVARTIQAVAVAQSNRPAARTARAFRALPSCRRMRTLARDRAADAVTRACRRRHQRACPRAAVLALRVAAVTRTRRSRNARARGSRRGTAASRSRRPTIGRCTGTCRGRIRRDSSSPMGSARAHWPLPRSRRRTCTTRRRASRCR